MSDTTFHIGDRVEKITGYRWPGVVVATFTTLAGKTRLVVECTSSDVAGALHIYAPEQLARDDGQRGGSSNGREQASEGRDQ